MRKREWFIVLSLGIMMILSIGLGRYALSPIEVIGILLGRASEGRMHALIYTIRLPRVLLVTISGMALGLSGLVYQKVFQNPLVSPDLLGASSGASLGAAIAIVFFSSSSLSISITAFVCSMLVVIGTMFLARYMKGKTLGLILAGIVTSALSSSLLMMLKVIGDPYKDLPSIEFWLMGGFYHASWQEIMILLPTCIIGVGLLFLIAYPLKVLTLGEESAKTLGMSFKKIRLIAIAGATLLVASVIAISGLVSWIGLIAPHIARLYSKQIERNNRWGDLVMAMVWGGLLLLVTDTICRTVFPTELPISVLTSFIGGILLAFLLIYQSRIKH